MQFEHIRISLNTDTDAAQASPTTTIAEVLRRIADDFEAGTVEAGAVYDNAGDFIGGISIVQSEGEDE